jgi:hypothetical protein
VEETESRCIFGYAYPVACLEETESRCIFGYAYPVACLEETESRCIFGYAYPVACDRSAAIITRGVQRNALLTNSTNTTD